MSKNEPIDNTADVIDSRDIIARIEYLENDRAEIVDNFTDGVWGDGKEALNEWDTTFGVELSELKSVAKEASDSPDWEHGETLIRESYFTSYIEELIDDCYELPKQLTSGKWPYRHIKVDYEAAAEEAKQDYIEVDFAGVTYFIRA